MNTKKIPMIVAMLIILSSSPSFAAPDIPKVCQTPEQMMPPEEVQRILINLISSNVINWDGRQRKFVIKDQNALDHLLANRRVEEICVLDTVVCW